MHFHLSGYIRRHTNEQLLNDLKKTAERIKKDTISNKTYRQIGAYCPSIITRRFGTWNNALCQAGLKVTKHFNIPIPQLFDNLRNLWIALGRQPSLSDLHPPQSRFSRRPYLRTFGKWSTALETFVASHKNSHQYIARPTSPPPPVERAAVRSNSLPSGEGRGGAISWRLRHLIMKRDNFRCRACGASPATNPNITLHIDHIIPTSKGGQSTPSNLQTLCSTCNIGKSNL